MEDLPTSQSILCPTFLITCNLTGKEGKEVHSKQTAWHRQRGGGPVSWEWQEVLSTQNWGHKNDMAPVNPLTPNREAGTKKGSIVFFHGRRGAS